MVAVYYYHHVVRNDELDGLGHGSNVAYLAWLQEAAIAHSAAVGLAIDDYQRMGSAWVVRRHEIEYLRPVVGGDPVVIRTWVANMGRVGSLRRYEACHETTGQLLARAATQWVFINRRSGRPVRIPEEVRSRFVVLEDLRGGGHAAPPRRRKKNRERSA